MRTFNRFIKITSAVTLFFFCWSFLPIYSAVAFAAAPQGKGAGSRSLQAAQGTGSRGQGPVTSGERFEKALEAIRENVSRAGDKEAKNQNITAEVAEIKKQRAEIESADIEFKKEFAATEKKLKDAKLPKEILDRQAKFVKHYEDNLAELKANLDSIEKPSAKNQELRAALQKTKAHLEKTKAPSRHQKLDPNNLPNRMVKAQKEKAPRLKKEEFEKDFPVKKKQKTNFTAENSEIAEKRLALQYISDANQREWARVALKSISPITYHSSPILKSTSLITHHTSPLQLAYNGDLSDLGVSLPRPATHELPLPIEGEGWGEGAIPPFALSTPQWNTPNSELSTPNLIVAQATTDPPSSDDLAETPEVQFTPEIRALAAQLNHSPVKIYEWVRNNIEFVPTYGSIQGAQMTMETKLGNAFDTASLLIALLRASGVSARYVYGTVEIPIDKAMNWVGGVSDPKMAGTILATNGIPAKMLVSGATYKAVQLEHVYVSAWIDYIPSRGAVQKQGDTWIPLDPSFKQYTYTPGMDIKSAVPFDAQTFANQILSMATTNTTDGSVTNVNSALVQQTMQNYQTQVQNYIQQNYPNATVGDVIGKKEIIQQNYPILLGTLPYKTVQVGSEFATVPDNLRETMSFSILDSTGTSAGFTYTTNMPQIAGKQMTLSFSPATAFDLAVINSYLPKPHADGTPIQPSELPTLFPAYLINLVPELRISGQVMATGMPGMMGTRQSFTMSLNESGIGVSNIENVINAGESFAVGLDTGRTAFAYINQTRKTSGKSADHIADLLSLTIAAYFGELEVADEMTSSVMGIVRYRVPSVGMSSLNLNVQETFGVPNRVSFKGMMMDVDRIMQTAFSKDGSVEKVKRYMVSSGINSSTLEYVAPERLFARSSNAVSAISAIKALKIANDQGIPIYILDKSNINIILPQLQVALDVKTDIINSVNAGKQVTVSKSNINFNGWTGCGYIISDPSTGTGAYMISGGMNGVQVLGVLSMMNSCPQSWDECYTHCINTLVPIAPWTVFTNVTLFGNALYYLGGGVTSITISGEVIVLMESPLVLSSICMTLSGALYAAGGAYLAWVAGASIGCMISCSIDQCNY